MTTASLSNEIRMLRSFAVSIVGRDPEGEYRPEFVRGILRASREKPRHRFVSAKAFLAELEKADD